MPLPAVTRSRKGIISSGPSGPPNEASRNAVVSAAHGMTSSDAPGPWGVGTVMPDIARTLQVVERRAGTKAASSLPAFLPSARQSGTPTPCSADPATRNFRVSASDSATARTRSRWPTV